MQWVFAIVLFGSLSVASFHADAAGIADEAKAARMADALKGIDQTCAEVMTLQSEVEALEAQDAERAEKGENEGLRSDDTAQSAEALIAGMTLEFSLAIKSGELAATQRLLDLRSANFVRFFGEEGEAILQDRCPR